MSAMKMAILARLMMLLDDVVSEPPRTAAAWIQTVSGKPPQEAARTLNTAIARVPDSMPESDAIIVLEWMEGGERMRAAHGEVQPPRPDVVTYACAASAALGAGLHEVADEILARGVRHAQRYPTLTKRTPQKKKKKKTGDLIGGLAILHQDDDILLVNKPNGMLAHAVDGEDDEPTVTQSLMAIVDSLKLSRLGGMQSCGIVHRLDKAVSGAMVVAKTDRAHASLVRSFFLREGIDKEYLALVAGRPEADAADIDNDVDSLPAHSHYELLGTSRRSDGVSSLLRVQTSTGRKHQVRRHLQSIGCPIFLDPLEPAFAQTRRGKKRATSQAGALGVSVSTQRRVPKPIADAADGAPAGERIFLHAARLCIQHPRTGLQLSVEAPPPKWWGPVLADLELSI